MRRIAWFLYLSLLALVALWPTPVDRDFSGLLDQIINTVQNQFGQAWLSYEVVEFSANILLLIPLGILLQASSRQGNQTILLSSGFAAVLLIELIQRILLPQRFSSLLDVLANSIGILCGFLIGKVFMNSQQKRRK